MESIEKLRELAADMNCTEIIDHLDVVGKFIFHAEWLDSWHKAFDAACDEIEREIEDKIDDLMATSVDGYPEPFNTPDAMHMVLGTAADCFDTPQEAVHYLRGETSMLLPVDADGVPIRPRDEVDTGMGEHGPIGHLEYWYPNNWVAVIEYKPGQFTRYDPAAICHVKPRTLEDVLQCAGVSVAAIEDVAAEIRELMEAGE